MKKVLSLILITVLILALAIPVAGTNAGEKQGVIKAFDEESVTLMVAGKDYKYAIDSNTEVKRIDMDVNFMDVAVKGIKVTFVESGNKLTYINFPNLGAEMQGTAKIAVADVRVNPTDSSLSADSTLATVDSVTGEVIQTTVARVKKLGFEPCDEYQYDNTKKITLGDIIIDKESVKVTVENKPLKVITDGKTDFSSAVVGDEVKLIEKTNTTTTTNGNTVTTLTYPSYTMEFEAPITTVESPKLDYINLILRVNYKKQGFEITTTETNFLAVDTEAVVELNGKEVPLSKALNMSNYWFVRTNTDGDVIHVDSFYRDAQAVFTGLSGDLINVNIMKNGKVMGSEALTPSAGLTVLAADGSEISVKNLKVNDKIVITTEPADGHCVTSIQQK